MKRFLLVAAASLLAAPLAQAQPGRVSAESVREAYIHPDVRSLLRQQVRGGLPDANMVASHEMAPAHLADAEGDEGPQEMGVRPPARLSQRLTATQARAALQGVEAEIQGVDLGPVRVSPQRANPTRTTPQRTSPTRTSPQRANPGRVITAQPARVNPGVVGPGQVAVPTGPQLDVLAFCGALHNALKDNANGYVMRLAQNGQPIATLQWNWARRPGDGSLGWNPNRRMHVASVSKLITAIAAVNLLHDKGISWDASIGQYLPTYWDRGANANNITFRELLTHTSGIEVPGSATNFPTMKAEIAAGVPNNPGGQYENTNFGLFRILIPVINGDVDKNAFAPLANLPAFEPIVDTWWDAITVNAYQAYVNQHVFAPAGVAGGPSLTHSPSDAIAYANPWGSGWDSGNLRSVSGGAGWVMSADQVLSVMAHYRHTDSIVPRSHAQSAMDARLGLDVRSQTPAGLLYNKNGLWRSNNRTEQSLAYFLPNGMELVVFANSPIAPIDSEGSGVFFRSLVTNIYLANLE